MITLAERRFPVRIRIAITAKTSRPAAYPMTTWLDENCGGGDFV
jgi:hypothetical protein